MGGGGCRLSKDEQHDSCQFMERLTQAAAGRGYFPENLGTSANPLLFFERRAPMSEQPRLLIAAGFHGDEPAGPWGLLHFLETAGEDLMQSAALAFLPLVNPSGLQRAQMVDDLGQNPNRGFCHPEFGHAPAREGRFLLSHLPVLKAASRDGFLTLHEDWEENAFYLYVFNRGGSGGAMAEALKHEAEKYFPLSTASTIDGRPAANSVILNNCDGSFEDLLFHEGAPITVCTETPSSFDFELRVNCIAVLIQAFIAESL